VTMELRKGKSLAELFPECRFDDVSGRTVPSEIFDDSRRVIPGALFCAVKGAHGSGEDFISMAFEKGAKAVAKDTENTQSSWRVINTGNDQLQIEFPRLKKNLAMLAANFFNHPANAMSSMVGVTGTNGKSSIVHMLEQAWRELGARSASMGTLGIRVGDALVDDLGLTTPGAIQLQRSLHLLVDRDIQRVAMEVSSHGIHQYRVEGVPFSAKVLTNITRDHLDYHASFAEYAQVKLGFIDSDQKCLRVLNWDDEHARQYAMDHPACDNVVSYSLADSRATVFVENLRVTDSGFSGRVCSPWGSGDLVTSMRGSFSVSNLLAVISVLCGEGFELKAVLNAVAIVKAAPGRLEFVSSSPRGADVFVDYAHTPDALLTVLQSLRPHTQGKIHLVFGCGGDRDQGKRGVMGNIASEYSDVIYVTSDNPRTEDPLKIVEDICAGIRDSKKIASTNVQRKQSIEEALSKARKGDSVLIAGKGHENYQIVGTEKLPFSDHSVVREYSAERCH